MLTYKISRLGNRWKARIGMSVILLLVKSLKRLKSLYKRVLQQIFIHIKYIIQTRYFSHVSTNYLCHVSNITESK